MSNKAVIKMNPSFGTHIQAAAEEALALATKQKCLVIFTFNGVEVAVDRDRTVEYIVDDWQAKFDAKALAYRESPAGQKAAQEAKERASAAQKGVVTRVSELATIGASGGFKTLEDAVKWLAKYSEVADHVESGSSSYRAAVLALFEKMGHTPNQLVNKDKLPTEEWKALVSRDGELRWLIGQGLDGIRTLGSPHPMIQIFAEQFGIDWKK